MEQDVSLLSQNQKDMQTILGSGGAIGTDLAKALTKYTDKIRLVSRNPKKVNQNDELFPADLADREMVFKAVEGSEVVYLTIGFEYKLTVWQEKWPTLMRNLIDACSEHKAKLVFFDNIYMYDKGHLSHMTEETPVNPCSKKGLIRAGIANNLTDAYKTNKVKALIARSADFYGPGINNSLLTEMVYKNFKKGKAANWIGTTGKIHNFTYTPDAALATALLGNTPDAYNQVWHLPTERTNLTGKQWIELFASEMKVPVKIQVLPVWMMGVLGLFLPVMKEMKEMAYQSELDYFFDSTKFETRFNLHPTSPREAVKAIVQEG